MSKNELIYYFCSIAVEVIAGTADKDAKTHHGMLGMTRLGA